MREGTYHHDGQAAAEGEARDGGQLGGMEHHDRLQQSSGGEEARREGSELYDELHQHIEELWE